MNTLSVEFNKTARSGSFYHADTYEAEGIHLRKAPVAAKRGNRIKLWITDVEQDDIELTINGVEEVAEWVNGDLFQVYTDAETWEQIVGVPGSNPGLSPAMAAKQAELQSRLDSEAAERRAQRAAEIRERDARLRAKRQVQIDKWNARVDRDACIETTWIPNPDYRGGGAAFWGENTDLPEWIGPDAKLGLGPRNPGGGQPIIWLYNAAGKREGYTLRINNVWVFFSPGYGGMQHNGLIIHEDYNKIFDYTGGELPNEPAPPRNAYEVRWECQNFGMDYQDEAAWRREMQEIQGKTFGIATATSQRNLYQEMRSGLLKDAVRLGGLVETYQKRVDALASVGESDQRLSNKLSGYKAQHGEKMRGIDTCDQRIKQQQDALDELLPEYERLIARREMWEDGINPDEVPEAITEEVPIAAEPEEILPDTVPM